MHLAFHQSIQVVVHSPFNFFAANVVPSLPPTSSLHNGPHTLRYMTSTTLCQYSLPTPTRASLSKIQQHTECLAPTTPAIIATATPMASLRMAGLRIVTQHMVALHQVTLRMVIRPTVISHPVVLHMVIPRMDSRLTVLPRMATHSRSVIATEPSIFVDHAAWSPGFVNATQPSRFAHAS
jgi:hypothetical protein